MATKGLDFWKHHLGRVPASVWDEVTGPVTTVLLGSPHPQVELL